MAVDAKDHLAGRFAAYLRGVAAEITAGRRHKLSTSGVALELRRVTMRLS